MKFPTAKIAHALVAGIVVVLPCHADSFTSSASSAGSASSGSLSDSVSSPSGSSKAHVAEGDYRIVDVAAAASAVPSAFAAERNRGVLCARTAVLQHDHSRRLGRALRDRQQGAHPKPAHVGFVEHLDLHARETLGDGARGF